MLFQIKSRFSAAAMAEVEVSCRSDASEATKLGKAIQAAVSNGANLYAADLGGADLRGANLRGANLYAANLRGADLRRANLRDANLRGANLGGANLYAADLYAADLRGANLRDADLDGADLRGADLYAADLRGADLGDAVSKVSKLVTSLVRSDGYTFFGFITESGSLGIVAGCQNRLLPSYRKHVTNDYPSRPNAAALIAETTDILDFMEKRYAAMTMDTYTSRDKAREEIADDADVLACCNLAGQFVPLR